LLGPLSLIIAFEAIFDWPDWSNYVQFLAKMTKSKIIIFLLNSWFYWSYGQKTHKNKDLNAVATCGQPQNEAKSSQSDWASSLAARIKNIFFRALKAQQAP
jgi:hypothetical protein